MSELGLVAVLTALITAVATYLGTSRTTRSTEVLDDRQALRTYFEMELALCRKKLEHIESTKTQGLDSLEEAVEVIRTYREELQQLQGTGGPS